jgi:type II secretory pathway pseudopilin PulG
MKNNCNGFTLIETAISFTILLLLTGVIMGSITNIYKATAQADNTMLVSAQNSRAVGAMREDLLQTSRNLPPSGNYGPFLDPDPWQSGTSELRFRRINGFNTSTGRATYENQYTCYWLDTTKDTLYRRYRDLSGTLLTTPPAKAIGTHVTVFTPEIDADAQTVTITLTTSRGSTEREEEATTTRTVIITPFNID